MKTIRKQNLESIARFLKRLRLFILIAIGILICFLIVRSYIISEYFCYRGPKHESMQSVYDVFSSNTYDFENAIVFFDETEIVQDLYTRYLTQKRTTYPTGDCLMDPWCQLHNAEFVTKEELKYITDFFERYGVYSIQYRYPYYELDFFCEDGWISLYYIPSTQKRPVKSTLSYLRQNFDVQHAFDNWYYCFSYYE